MVKSLLMVLWLDGTTIRHSFRYATLVESNGNSVLLTACSQYKDPYIYTSSVPFTELSKTINATHMAITYRCVGSGIQYLSISFLTITDASPGNTTT